MPQNVKQENHFILLTLFLVLILGIPTLRSLTHDESNTERTAEILATEVSTSFQKDDSRRPASNGDSNPKSDDESEKQTQTYRLQAENLDLECQTGDLQKTIHSLRLRIQGKSCKLLGPTETLKIINETNGFTASIFIKDQNTFMTDLIHLSPGKNTILFKDRKSTLRRVQIFVNPILEQIAEKNP